MQCYMDRYFWGPDDWIEATLALGKARFLFLLMEILAKSMNSWSWKLLHSLCMHEGAKSVKQIVALNIDQTCSIDIVIPAATSFLLFLEVLSKLMTFTFRFFRTLHLQHIANIHNIDHSMQIISTLWPLHWILNKHTCWWILRDKVP